MYSSLNVNTFNYWIREIKVMKQLGIMVLHSLVDFGIQYQSLPDCVVFIHFFFISCKYFIFQGCGPF